MVDQHPWIVLGAGGHARSVMDVLHRQFTGAFLFVAPTAELPFWAPTRSQAIAEENLDSERFEGYHWLVALGDNAVRQRLMRDVVPPMASMPTVVASSATVAADAVLGRGVVVLEHAHIGPGAVVGDGVIVNTGAVVEHDSTIGEFTHVAPMSVVLGSASVGARSLVGAGSTILPGLKIGEDVTIGAGSVVVKDIPSWATAVGVPARVAGTGRTT
jgi:sugar O-acyltransferase (sialic acid O-acetyltransferase NeuD family)